MLVTKELLKVSCIFESSFQSPSLCTADVSLDCQAQRLRAVKCATRPSQEVMASDVWGQWSSELTGIPLGCGQRAPDRSLCFQTRQRFHSPLGGTSSSPFKYINSPTMLSRSLLNTDFQCLKQTSKTWFCDCASHPNKSATETTRSLWDLYSLGAAPHRTKNMVFMTTQNWAQILAFSTWHTRQVT